VIIQKCTLNVSIQWRYAPLRSAEFRRFFSRNFHRNPRDLFYIFQKFLPFPVFLVYNFKLLSTFLQLSLSQANIRHRYLKQLKSLKKYWKRQKFVKNINLNDSGGIPAEIPGKNRRILPKILKFAGIPTKFFQLFRLFFRLFETLIKI
jgi:hypothetical protein